MAVYEVQCMFCGKSADQWHSMPRAGGLPAFDPSECCKWAVRKIHHAPADHSDNSFRPRWSDNLSTTGDPVYVKTAGEYRQLKSKLGLTEHEKGMTEDKRRRDRETNQKAIDTSFQKIVEGVV